MIIKHLTTLDGWKLEDYYRFFKSVEKFENNKFKSLKNKIITNLFYEPSTRTSSSFFSAAKRIGADVISINDVNYSSVVKGETLEDTVRTLECYSDAIILRHSEIGAAKRAALVSSVPIINAGDGAGEHPTQTLLDLYTIYKEFDTIENLSICFIGDNKNSRTVHSLEKALHGISYLKYQDYDVDDKTPKANIYYLTRVQKERGSIGAYQFDVKSLPSNCIVMHPFPRNEEIPSWFDSDSRAFYFKQIQNGLYVRMALLHWCLT